MNFFFGLSGDFRSNKFHTRYLLDRTIHIIGMVSPGCDMDRTVIFSGMLTCIWTVRSPNANFQNLEILNFQFSSIHPFLGHVFELIPLKRCSYGPYEPFRFSVKSEF